MTLKAIGDDPEFFHGLTMWGDEWSAQIRDDEVILYFAHGDASPGGTEYAIDAEEARRLRDLLNVATARGAL